MKYPVVLPYLKTEDQGMELRYMLRSLKNVTNFNGDVYIVGDKENWFYNINHIPQKRDYGKIYLDQIKKMYTACLLPEMPEKFIATMDDCYVTKKQEIGVYSIGELKDERNSIHRRTKYHTKQKLKDMELPTLDYEAHAPMLVNKNDLLVTLSTILEQPSRKSLQWRSMYGNMFNVEAKWIEDKKTKTTKLKSGDIISTNFYTPELQKLFPDPSPYEISL